MKEVDRACFECYYSDENIYLRPENAGIGRAFAETNCTEFVRTNDPCDLCGSEGSLKKE